MHLYTGILDNNPVASSEIEEIAWFSKDKVFSMHEVMIPMTIRYVVPFLQSVKYW